MPLYEFVCTCGKRREAVLSVKAEPPLCTCGKRMQRLFVPENILFIMKGDPQGSTPGVRKKAEEITKKSLEGK